jgi:hypothetical protein
VSDVSINFWGYKAIVTVFYPIPSVYISPPAAWDLSHFLLTRFLSIIKTDFVRIPKIPLDCDTKDAPDFPNEKLAKNPCLTNSLIGIWTCFLETEVAIELDEVGLVASCPLCFLKALWDNEINPRVLLIRFLLCKQQDINPDVYAELLKSAVDDSLDISEFADSCFQSALSDVRAPKVTIETILSAIANLQNSLRIQDSILWDNAGLLPEFSKQFLAFSVPLSSNLPALFSERLSTLFQLAPVLVSDPVQIPKIVLTELPVNRPTHTLPAVPLVLELFRGNADFVKPLVLGCLRLNLPFVVPTLLRLIEKVPFKTSLSAFPQTFEILESIGNGMSIPISELAQPKGDAFDCGESFSISRAYVLRLILDSTKYSEFLPALQEPRTALGSLMVMSIRFLRPFRNQKVTIRADGSEARLTAVGPVQYRFEDDNLVQFGIVPIHHPTLQPNSLPFDCCPIEPVGEVPRELVELVSAKCSDDDPLIARFAKSALAELSLNTSLAKRPVCSGLKELLDEPVLVSIAADLWKWSSSVNSICFSLKPKSRFSLRQAESDCDEFWFLRNESTLQLRDGTELPAQSRDTINVIVIGDDKHVILQNGDSLFITREFLGHCPDLIPHFLGPEAPAIHPPSPFLLQTASEFSRVLVGTKLLSLKDQPIPQSDVFHFLPCLNPSQLFFFQFITSSNSVVLRLIDGLQLFQCLYEATADRPVEGEVLGFGFDPIRRAAFLTRHRNVVHSAFVSEFQSGFTLVIQCPSVSSFVVHSNRALFECAFDVAGRFEPKRNDPLPLPRFSLPKSVPKNSFFATESSYRNATKPCFAIADLQFSQGWLVDCAGVRLMQTFGDLVSPPTQRNCLTLIDSLLVNDQSFQIAYHRLRHSLRFADHCLLASRRLPTSSSSAENGFPDS